MKHIFIASASELQTSPLFLQITTPMFLADEANLNKVRCTEGFIDDIIANQDRYVGLPLAVDIKNLTAGRLENLGHMFNPITGTYGTTGIGSFQGFEKRTLDGGQTALVGYARVWKRNAAVCRTLSEMFADGKLQFSFEINAGTQIVRDDGTITIDAAENNYLEGMCVVSFPACPEAVAEQLVAELIPKDGDAMDNMVEQVSTEVEAEVEKIKENVEPEVVETEVVAEAEPEVVATEVEAEEPASEEVSAEMRITETHVEVDEVEAHDWENDEHATERIVHEVSVTHVAEQEETESKPEPETEVRAEAMMAELLDRMNEMAKQIAELTALVQRDTTDEVIASIAESEIGEQETKLTAEMNVNSVQYKLLQPEETITQYTLL